MCYFFRKVASLDTEVYASGFTKDMEQDLQKEVSSTYFPHIECVCVCNLCLVVKLPCYFYSSTPVMQVIVMKTLLSL